MNKPINKTKKTPIVIGVEGMEVSTRPNLIFVLLLLERYLSLIIKLFIVSVFFIAYTDVGMCPYLSFVNPYVLLLLFLSKSIFIFLD